MACLCERHASLTLTLTQSLTQRLAKTLAQTLTETLTPTLTLTLTPNQVRASRLAARVPLQHRIGAVRRRPTP